MIEFTHVVPSIDGHDGWITIIGHESSDESAGYSFHHMPIDALQWRIVEYGLEDGDLDTAFKIVMSEALDARHKSGNIDDVDPYASDPEEALRKKLDHVAQVSAEQGRIIEENRRSISVDRAELVEQISELLPEDGLSGRAMEEKRLIVHGIRASDPMEESAVSYAMDLVSAGLVNNAEAALVAGRYDVESKIEGGISQDDLIVQHELEMLAISEQMEMGQANAESGELDRAEAGESGGGSEGSAGS